MQVRLHELRDGVEVVKSRLRSWKVDVSHINDVLVMEVPQEPQLLQFLACVVDRLKGSHLRLKSLHLLDGNRVPRDLIASRAHTAVRTCCEACFLSATYFRPSSQTPINHPLREKN